MFECMWSEDSFPEIIFHPLWIQEIRLRWSGLYFKGFYPLSHSPAPGLNSWLKYIDFDSVVL